MAGLVLVVAQFLDPTQGPDQSGGFQVSPTYFIVLFFVGFAVGGVGHLAKSKTLLTIGVMLVFLATFALPLLLAISH